MGDNDCESKSETNEVKPEFFSREPLDLSAHKLNSSSSNPSSSEGNLQENLKDEKHDSKLAANGGYEFRSEVFKVSFEVRYLFQLFFHFLLW